MLALDVCLKLATLFPQRMDLFSNTIGVLSCKLLTIISRMSCVLFVEFKEAYKKVRTLKFTIDKVTELDRSHGHI